MKPPNVKDNWDDNDVWTQCLLIAYEQIRQMEHSEQMGDMLKVILS